MKFEIKSKSSLENAWNAITTQEQLNLWFCIESNINLKKRGEFFLVFDNSGKHNTKDCTIIDIQAPNTEIGKTGILVIFWKGPRKFDITMNEFEDSWTQIKFVVKDSNPVSIIIEHTGWKSSEDWQQAKEWHEKQFWPEKIENLKVLLN